MTTMTMRRAAYDPQVEKQMSFSIPNLELVSRKIKPCARIKSLEELLAKSSLAFIAR
jgi:hypothetical protein